MGCTMIDFYRQFARILAREPAVLATVIDIKGSVPREIGAKMIVANGQTVGTIGGGAGEAKIIRCAIEVLKSGKKQAVEIDLTGATGRVVEGVCGGKMRVWLERWQDANLIETILTQLQAGRSLQLVTPFNQARSPYLSAEASTEAFIEVLDPPPTLLIIGAGHCGIALAKVAHLIGFQIVVYDDRSEWANPKRYPQATQIFNDHIESALAPLAIHAQLYAALVTRGYQHDLTALQALLNREVGCRYIGMIGSEKRVRQVYQAIDASPEKLRSIHAPIGLDIGALTPEEIAVSISAELILVRRGGTGQPLSEKLRRTTGSISPKSLSRSQPRIIGTM